MSSDAPWILSLDRSQWHLGSKVINILVLALVHQGVAIAVFWLFLPNRSNAYTDQRMMLMQRLQRVIPTQAIAFVTAERAFIGREWIAALQADPIGFRIREKEQLRDQHCALSAHLVFAHLQPGQSQVMAQPRRLWGQSVWMTALRLSDGELLIVVTSDAPDALISDDALPWQIEPLLGCLKSRGLNLEQTHLMTPTCLSKLLALLTLALCWAIRVDEWQAQLRPIPLKQHGRKAKSVFRLGVDHLRRIVLNLAQYLCEFQLTLQFLSST